MGVTTAAIINNTGQWPERWIQMLRLLIIAKPGLVDNATLLISSTPALDITKYLVDVLINWVVLTGLLTGLGSGELSFIFI